MSEALLKALKKAKQDDFIIWDEPNDTALLTNQFKDAIEYYYNKSNMKNARVLMVIA